MEGGERGLFGRVRVVHGSAKISDDGFVLGEVSGQETQETLHRSPRKTNIDMFGRGTPDIQDHTLQLKSRFPKLYLGEFSNGHSVVK